MNATQQRRQRQRNANMRHSLSTTKDCLNESQTYLRHLQHSVAESRTFNQKALEYVDMIRESFLRAEKMPRVVYPV